VHRFIPFDETKKDVPAKPPTKPHTQNKAHRKQKCTEGKKQINELVVANTSAAAGYSFYTPGACMIHTQAQYMQNYKL
jgi:hypothetical protein